MNEFETSIQLSRQANPGLFLRHDSVFDQEAKNVKRFRDNEMIHQTSLAIHTTRLRELATSLVPTMTCPGTDLNLYRIIDLIDTHDVPEVVTGDIPTPQKRNLSQTARADLSLLEAKIAKEWAPVCVPPGLEAEFISRYQEAVSKQSQEAQFVDIIDKWDGLGEAVHEVRCGNTQFLEIIERYRNIFPEFAGYPLWDIMATDPDIGLGQIPTSEEVQRYSTISLADYYADPQTFWQTVMDPALPPFMKRWLNASLTGFNFICGTALFSGWKFELGYQSPELWEPLLFESGKSS
ncbi:MAG: YfbR-like 5'-deoxynucleotidase [Patescibacteria group bacterium]